MQDKLSQEVQKILDDEIKNRLAETNSDVKYFQQASDDFEDLKRRGLVKSRGYNLLTIDQAHLHRMKFNISDNK